MKTTILTFFVTIMIVPLCAFGQQGIFEYADERNADLTTEQFELLKNLQSKPQTINVYLVTVTGVAEIGNIEQLILNLPDETDLTVDRTSRVSLQREQVRWNGSASNDESDVRLLIRQDAITGMIRSKAYNYDIHPLRNSEFHVLVKIDPSGFDREEAPLMIDGNNDSENHDYNGFDKGESAILSNPEIRVMVVYTTNAKNNYSGDINQLISFAVGNMEDAFTTSGVNADINLVHTAEISYSESTDGVLNLCRLTMSQTFDPRDDPISTSCDGYSTGMISGYLNEIHNWRYQYDAHLVTLITGSGEAGRAWMPAFNNYAFSIARYDVAASNYTLAHEIGHNLAAHHDTLNAQNPVYPYAHGYIYHPLEWTTIMAYPPSGYNRIIRYSTPLKTYAGVPTGTAALHDNARAMNNRVNSVANFSPPAPPPPPPSVSISGPSNMFQGTSDTFTANVSGGTPPYNYQWYYRHETNWNWTATGTNSSTYFHTAGAPNGEYVRVVVTDAYPNDNEDTHYFTIIGMSFSQEDSENIELQPQNFALTQNYPNPFNPTTTISYDLPEQADVLLQVFDLMGRKVTTLEAANRSAGSYTATFDASQLSSGVYIARMRATGVSGEIFTRELKMQLVK